MKRVISILDSVLNLCGITLAKSEVGGIFAGYTFDGRMCSTFGSEFGDSSRTGVLSGACNTNSKVKT